MDPAAVVVRPSPAGDGRELRVHRGDDGEDHREGDDRQEPAVGAVFAGRVGKWCAGSECIAQVDHLMCYV